MNQAITIEERNCRQHPPTGKEAGCGGCERVFGGDRGFDKHRRDGQCLHPSTVGLSLSPSGVWVQPYLR